MYNQPWERLSAHEPLTRYKAKNQTIQFFVSKVKVPKSYYCGSMQVFLKRLIINFHPAKEQDENIYRRNEGTKLSKNTWKCRHTFIDRWILASEIKHLIGLSFSAAVWANQDLPFVKYKYKHNFQKFSEITFAKQVVSVLEIVTFRIIQQNGKIYFSVSL